MTTTINLEINEADVVGEEDDKRTLWQKWKDHYGNRKNMRGSKHVNTFKAMTRCLMAVQAPTQLWLFHFYIIPVLFHDYNPWTRYYLKVLVTFLCLQELMNYMCTICYYTGIPDPRDRPTATGIKDNWENAPDRFMGLIADRQQNGFAVEYRTDVCDDGGLPWTYCDECNIDVPPRAHHCRICKTCILKRDHHCYIVGNCIGFKNQRYFVVMAFYALLCGGLGGLFTFQYLQEYYYPISSSWIDFVPMVAVFRWLLGNMQLHVMWLIWQIYLEFFFGFVGFVYFSSQMAIIAQGKTLYEITKEVPIKNMNSINENFRSVFGDFWALNFLFPMQIILQQRDNGMVWEGVKLDHNANHKMN